jgi:two-component system phosphate regulon sensor histidine kinase PhoR
MTNWLLPRMAATLAAMAGGCALGYAAGRFFGSPEAGTAVGAASSVVLLSVVDAIRGQTLVHWLRQSSEEPTPRTTGFWGEIGYRIERALRQREQALERERNRLSQFLSAIEASPNGVLLLDAGDHIEWCNTVAADHLGLDPVRDRGQPLANLVRSPVFVAHLQGGDWQDPVSFQSPGSSSTVSILIRTYGDGQKLVLTSDVTERIRAQATLRDFVANVSHEIRTPLTAVSGFVQTLGELELDDHERARVLTLMRQQTDRMQTLVGDLLILARLEGSPRPLPDRWIGLRGLLQRVEDEARAASAGRHQIAFHLPVSDVQLAGSESELLSAVSNLVHNAIRYTADNGRVDVRWLQRADGCGEIEVRDTGIGITREHLPRLTERFYRVDGSRSRGTGGTGLGLSIVKHVVHRHGGELMIESEPGKGSRFRFSLPASRVRPSREFQPTPDIAAA